jgi:tricorn protease
MVNIFILHPTGLKPAYPFGLSDARVYTDCLWKNFHNEFRSNKYDSLFIEKSKSVAPKTDSLNTKPKMADYTIDFNHILDRVELVSPNFGTQGRSYVLRKEDKTVVIYSSNHSENEFHFWMTTYEPFEKI